jgi:tetratricopeptide (TPR) repeat protein
MIGERRFLKTMSLLTLLVFFYMTISSCSIYHTDWANFKFWSKGKQSAMDEKDVNRFVGKIRIRQGNPESHYLLACYHQERGKHREAITEFEKVLFIDSTHVKAYNGKGISHDQLGEYAKAEESYRMALSLDPKLDYVWNNLGYSRVLQGDYVEAIVAFRKALDLNEKEGRIRNNLAMAYAMAGDNEKAFGEFEIAGGADRSHPHLKMASVYYEKAMFRQAIDSYRSALTLNPSSEVAKKGLEASEGLLQIAEVATEGRDECPGELPGCRPALRKGGLPGGEEAFYPGCCGEPLSRERPERTGRFGGPSQNLRGILRPQGPRGHPEGDDNRHIPER